ncbi:MAG: CPBP family intramembrane metalloprotease [Gammaproteobacteria bacterium]|nr:CPBP family intramembrane metalloprotease [Gammaproteobacteria bacterium]MBT8110413.1 CPBP family intramembrane metalloprotease [Gammaproteobacteria bacterium]NND46579.1 CPBP family intramembrane metalloprotease [Woeseiaceae bacterium]NNL45113.1 CPBP family intramembrane metalloprotease [Woeseiaceae bacterium]
MNQQPLHSVPPIVRFWHRVPIVIRAVVIGFLVFAIAGSVAWTLVLSLIPPPWSILAMVAILWVYWRYFRGDWWPDSTRAFRKQCFRSTSLPTKVWTWSLIAALTAAVLLQSILVVTFRIVEFPAEAWKLPYDFSALPVWQVWMLLVLAAMVAGITEEIGFRGYMQVPLEERYGPVVAITIVSVVFTVAHFTQAWAGGIIIILFAISVVWGVLARVSGSLIPGIVSHASTDVVNFSYWWTDIAGSFDKEPISQTGIDTHFILSLTILLALVSLFAFAARKTLLLRRASNPQ